MGLGLGWQANDGHGTIAREAAKRATDHDALDAAIALEKNPPVKPPLDHNPRVALGVPPFCTSRPVARFPDAASAQVAMPASSLERQHGGSASASVISGGAIGSTACRRRAKSGGGSVAPSDVASKAGRVRGEG